MINAAHRNGISVAALHYRFVNGEDVLFPAPQHDCARAIQFLRSKAKRVESRSAAVCLGFHDDLAQPENDDPIARESTRVGAIGTMGRQGTYDPMKIKDLIGGRAWEHPSILKVYGLKSAENALHPSKDLQSLYDEAAGGIHLPPLCPSRAIGVSCDPQSTATLCVSDACPRLRGSLPLLPEMLCRSGGQIDAKANASGGKLTDSSWVTNAVLAAR